MQLWEKNGELYLTLGLYVDLNEDDETTALPMATDPDFALSERVPPSSIFPTAQDDPAPEGDNMKTEPVIPSATPQTRGPGPFAAEDLQSHSLSANLNGVHEIQEDVNYEDNVPTGFPNGLSS
jgi:hypothetical protein